MNDPFAVLGLAASASLDDVRRRYLELTRQFTPERDPERFAEIRAAYEKARDPYALWERRLFDLRSADTLPALADEVSRGALAARLPVPLLLSLAEAK